MEIEMPMARTGGAQRSVQISMEEEKGIAESCSSLPSSPIPSPFSSPLPPPLSQTVSHLTPLRHSLCLTHPGTLL